MAKYIINIPEQTDYINAVWWTSDKYCCKTIDRSSMTPYTEPDDLEIRKRAINEVCSKFAANEFYCGDNLKSAFICMAEGKEVGQVKCFCLGEAEDEIRHKVENEVWEFVKALYGLSDEELYEIFPNGCPYEMTYSEAKAQYDSWKKSKSEIRIGDELINHIGETYVIYDVDDHIAYGINLDKYPCSQECFPVEDDYYPKRTGRTFPEFAELLKKMREE